MTENSFLELKKQHQQMAQSQSATVASDTIFDIATIANNLKQMQQIATQEHTVDKKLQLKKCQFCGKVGKMALHDYERAEVVCNCDKYYDSLKEQWREHQKNRIKKMIPKLYQNKSFDNFKIEQAGFILKIKQALKGGCQSALFAGDIGTGKTHLAFSWVQEICLSITEFHMQTIDSEYYQLEEYKNCPLPSFLYGTMTEILSSVIDKSKSLLDYKNAQILIMDDLGLGSQKDWVQDRVFELINHRYIEQKATIITTSLESKRLISIIGDRTWSRLVEMCKMYKIDNNNNNRFKKAVL